MNEAQTFSGLVKRDRPTVLYFWAPWCTPCRGMTSQVDRLGKAYEGRVHVRKINADEQPDVVRALRVFGIPTVIIYQGDQAEIRKTGALSAQALEAIFLAAEHGEVVPIHGLRPADRLLRSLAGLALGVIGWFAGPSWLLVAGGGVVLFSAIYDRCPVWRAFTWWLHDVKRVYVDRL